MLPKSPQRQQAMWSVKPLANMDLRFQKRTSVRMEIFREKEENEGRESKNGQTAVWQILWDVVEGWWCFHCWHQHKFSWRGSPCPAWAQHWETGEEILRAAREWNQRAGAPRPLTHWTPRWPHNSLWLSHTQSYMHRHTQNRHTRPHTHTLRVRQRCTVRREQTKPHIYITFETIWDQCSSLCVFRVWSIWKQCICFCHLISSVCPCTAPRGGAHWPASELWGVQWWTKGSMSPVWGASLKLDRHTLTHADLCVSYWACMHTHTHMQTRAAWVNDDVISPDILEMSGARKWGYASCHLQALSMNVCMCEHTMPSKLLETVQWTWWPLYSMPQWVGFPPQLLRKEAHTQWPP